MKPASAAPWVTVPPIPIAQCERNMIIVCEIPKGTNPSEFDPFPGSDKALGLGCVCPEQKHWPEHLHFSSDCPVHELVHAKN